MTYESIYLGAVIALAFFLFYTHWIRADVTALCVLLSLVIPWRQTAEGTLEGILTVKDAFSGFGSSAIIMVAAMFVLSHAMVRTGAAELIGERLIAVSSRSELSLHVMILIGVTLFSAFINDTMTVLIWMPLILKLSRDRGFSPSRLLLPLAFASLLGGQWTLIGTRSNIVLSDYLRLHTGEGLGFFSFTPVAACVLAVSAVYFLLVGRRFLPRGRREPGAVERYDVAEYVAEAAVAPGADIAGRPLGEIDLDEGLSVLRVSRGGKLLPPGKHLALREGDILIVQGRMHEIAALLDSAAFRMRRGETKRLGSAELQVVEAVVSWRSAFEGRSLREIDFERRFGPLILGVGRGGRPVTRRLAEHRLRVGDSLLLAATEHEIQELRGLPDLLLLEPRPLPIPGTRKAYLTLGLMLFIVVASASGLLEPVLAIFIAALGAVLAGCTSMRGAYESIDWRAIIVLGGMIAYGLALEETGTAELLAAGFTELMEPGGPRALFAGVLLAAVLLTQLIENAAVAVVLAPIAYQTAMSAGLEPMPFVLGVAICTSSAFMTPVAHESTILVMSAGRYRFADYLRAGTPLVLITWAVTVLVLPLFYPLG